MFIRVVVMTTFSRFVSGLKPYVFFEHMKLISKNKMTFGHIYVVRTTPSLLVLGGGCQNKNKHVFRCYLTLKSSKDKTKYT